MSLSSPVTISIFPWQMMLCLDSRISWVDARCKLDVLFIAWQIIIDVWLTINSEDYVVTTPSTLQWRHDGRKCVSDYQPHDCLLNRLFRHRSKNTSNLRVTGLCVGNSQMASNAENVSIWWRNMHLSYITLNSCIKWKAWFSGTW